MPDETTYERERRLVAEAERRARVQAHLELHDSLLTKLTTDFGALKEAVGNLVAEFRKSVTEAETRAADAERAAAKQVTSREFFLGMVAGTATIIGTMAATGVFG